jgi:hypothetical protein
MAVGPLEALGDHDGEVLEKIPIAFTAPKPLK